MREADDVAVNIGHRVIDGIAHPGLGGKVDNALGFVRSKNGFNSLAVGQIDAQVGVVGVIGMPGQTCFFDGGVVIVVVVVDTYDGVATLKESCDGDQNRYEMIRDLIGLENNMRHVSRRTGMMEEIDDIMKKHLFGSREEAKNFYLELNLGGFKGAQGGEADAGEPKPVIE